MPNLTLSFNEDLLKKSRKYAKEKGISLNSLIRELLTKTIQNNSTEWLDDCFKIMDKSAANSYGEYWKREDLYNE
jgi:ribonuclease D